LSFDQTLAGDPEYPRVCRTIDELLFSTEKELFPLHDESHRRPERILRDLRSLKANAGFLG
jgi:hypothetical protein